MSLKGKSEFHRYSRTKRRAFPERYSERKGKVGRKNRQFEFFYFENMTSKCAFKMPLDMY